MSSQEVQSLPGVPVNDVDDGDEHDGNNDHGDDHDGDYDTDDEDHLGRECTLNLLCSRHQGNEEGSGSSPTLNPGFFYHENEDKDIDS